jgi:phospholipase C
MPPLVTVSIGTQISAPDGNISPGTTMAQGQWAISANNAYVLILQYDGNLVLYQVSGMPPTSGSSSFQGYAIWATGTNGSGANLFDITTSGNLILYNGDTSVWSPSIEVQPPLELRVQTDGNLVLYTQGGGTSWSTGTFDTQASTTVYINNNSGSNAWIILQHQNSTNGLQSGVWYAEAGATVGPLIACFETGNAVEDYWWVYLGITNGEIYTNGGTLIPDWKPCMLMHEDNGKTYTFSVSTTEFILPTYKNDNCSVSSTGIPFTFPITNVFVLMLENHSLDNMLGLSGISGITPMTTDNYNSYNGNKYQVTSSAPVSMPTDPGHEFADVLEQLTNTTSFTPPLGPYPAIAPNPGFANSSGFAANYATSSDEGTGLPTVVQIDDIMACFTPAQVPVINELANEFAVCSQWFSSLPGPTWPNRFFVHLASSGGLDDSPSSKQITNWETDPLDGFSAPNGSIYDRLSGADLSYRIYNDCIPLYDTNGGYSLFSDNPNASDGLIGLGYIPQVTSLQGIHLAEVNSLQHFPSDLLSPYPYVYTFIEPHYGNVYSNYYQGGSSQHPMDDVYGGEALMKYVYESIRNSPIWNTSLLIITYDEHGGFYDSVPPLSATPPGDGSPGYGQRGSWNTNGFQFDQYGVRVPAVVISPFIAQGTLETCIHDHTSVLATVERLFGLTPLTNRDASANSLVSLFTESTPRTDCPATLSSPISSALAKRAPLTVAEEAAIDAEPLPQSGNVIGALMILLKTDYELSGQTTAAKDLVKTKFAALKTKQDLKAYASEVAKKLAAAQAVRYGKDTAGKV